jgi:starch phosphorylase
LLKKLSTQIIVRIGEEQVKVGVWQYQIKGKNNFVIPVYFLDTDIPGNSAASRQLTGQLYGGDQEYRLKQEIILGRGGVKMLQALGYQQIKKFHLNEGHGALASIELFLNSSAQSRRAKIAAVRRRCVFTTHTPLRREQDIFSLPYLLRYQPDFPQSLPGLLTQGEVNMTVIGLYFSGYTNAVSRRHQAISQRAYPGYKIRAVTNGVNSLTWTAPEFKRLYDQYLPGWRVDNSLLAQAQTVPLVSLWTAHQQAKRRLLDYVNKSTAAHLSEKTLTIGFARRFTPYKRPEFLFQDARRLLAAQKKIGQLQIIYAGKAHPQDLEGRELIKRLWQFKRKLAAKIKIVFLEDYSLDQARLLVAGVDLWLNTPLPPNEASGTSGMKAAHNGVLQASTLDGWWLEGYKKNKTGWAIKENQRTGQNNLYDLLEQEILPAYYQQPLSWQRMMRWAISCNAAYFNTQRVLEQYIKGAYK